MNLIAVSNILGFTLIFILLIEGLPMITFSQTCTQDIAIEPVKFSPQNKKYIA